jgi:regulator of sigma D
MAMHIIILNCADDTEKKRVRYVIDKWGAEKSGRVSEVKAIVVKTDLEGNEVADFLEELHSKISAGGLETYKAELEELEPEKKIEHLKAVFKEDLKSVERLISFIFSKKNAVLQGQRYLSQTFSELEYSVYTRRGKGGVGVKFVLKEEGGETTVDVRLEGLEEACRALKEELITDFSYFKVILEGEGRAGGVG